MFCQVWTVLACSSATNSVSRSAVLFCPCLWLFWFKHLALDRTLAMLFSFSYRSHRGMWLVQTKMKTKPCYWLYEQILLLANKKINYTLIHLSFHTLIIMKEAQDESLATENIHPFSSIVKRWIEKVQLIKLISNSVVFINQPISLWR